MDAGAAGQQAEALGGGGLSRGRRDAVLEPAHRACALAADQDPLLPALAQDAVEPVGAPDREQVDHAAPAGVDHVLGQQVLAHVDSVDRRGGTARSSSARSRARRTSAGSSRSGPRGRRSPSAAGRSAAASESASSTIASTIASLPLRRLNSWPPRTRIRPPGFIGPKRCRTPLERERHRRRGRRAPR